MGLFGNMAPPIPAFMVSGPASHAACVTTEKIGVDMHVPNAHNYVHNQSITNTGARVRLPLCSSEKSARPYS